MSVDRIQEEEVLVLRRAVAGGARGFSTRRWDATPVWHLAHRGLLRWEPRLMRYQVTTKGRSWLGEHDA